jgi:signal transduction histidine kinase
MKNLINKIKALINRVDTGTWHSLLVLASFQVILVVLLLATSAGLTSLRQAHEETSRLIRDNQIKSLLISRMHESIRERMWRVYQMIDQHDDPFEIEQSWEKFSHLAGDFVRAREELLRFSLSETELIMLEEHRPLVNKTQEAMHRVIDFVRQNDINNARYWVRLARETAEQVLRDLNAMHATQEDTVQRQISKTTLESFSQSQRQVLIMDGLAVLFCLAVITFVIYRIMTREDALSQALNDLRVSNELLESRVAERTADLVAARDTALEASHTKSRFLANMSHELRTPLNAIIGYSDMIKEEIEDLSSKEILCDITKINSAGKNLLELINDILDISKIEAGKMDIKLHNFPLKPLINEVMDTVRPMISKNRNTLRLHYETDAEEMYADQMRVRQVLLNLLSNASKFTQHGTICLEVQQRSVNNRTWITFRIIDTGIGISKEQQIKLFKPFSQVDSSSTRKQGGTGLGLVISLKFCQMMGGNIYIQSDLGKGCTCTVELPLQVEQIVDLTDDIMGESTPLID